MKKNEPIFRLHKKRGPKSEAGKKNSMANLRRGTKFSSENQPGRGGPRKALSLPMKIIGSDVVISNFRELTQFCREHVRDAIAVIHGAMMSPNTPLALRTDLARWFVERGFGKAPQPLMLPPDQTPGSQRPPVTWSEKEMEDFAKGTLEIINQHKNRRQTIDSDGETSGEVEEIIVSPNGNGAAHPHELPPDDDEEIKL